MSFETPILFLVFNRPDTTRRVFERIKEIRPAKLFVAADGPRAGREGEKEKCEEVRNLIIRGIDWPCEVKTLFRDSNLGCGHAVSGAITWFFENVEEGIILEDDTLPDLSFFPFCKELLAKYRDNETIKIISGDNFRTNENNDGHSYYFTKLFHIWGWATWRRTWQAYNFNLDSWADREIRMVIKEQFGDDKIAEAFTKQIVQVRDKKIDTWDYQLGLSIWKNRGINIIPSLNLISNIGFGENALHTINVNDELSNLKSYSLISIIHPREIKVDRRADKKVAYRTLYIKETLLSRAVKRIFKNIK